MNQLAEAQLADSYYGEFDEDDEEMHDPVAIQEQFAKNQDKFNRVLNLDGLRAADDNSTGSKRKAIHDQILSMGGGSNDYGVDYDDESAFDNDEGYELVKMSDLEHRRHR